MTEYDRGRAAGLAEAVKVAEDVARLRKLSFEVDNNPRNTNMADCATAIAKILRALSTSPGEHVLVPRSDLASILDSFAAESDHDALEASEPYKRLRAMLSAEK